MESTQIALLLLLLLASFVLCCRATSEAQHAHPEPPAEMSKSKEAVVRKILADYDTDVEPTEDTNTTVSLRLNILCATPNSIDGWIFMLWDDARLSWDPSEFGDVDRVHLSADRIWKPDLRLYDPGWMELRDVKAIVRSDGSVMWVPPVNYYINCEYGHNDTHNCTFRMGSWTYSGDLVDFQAASGSEIAWLHSYSEACEFVVQSHSSRRNVRYYSGVDEPYVDISVNLKLAWRHSR